jgi:hypothetical protein
VPEGIDPPLGVWLTGNLAARGWNLPDAPLDPVSLGRRIARDLGR